jgi:DNA-binding transcriptional MerR regulator
MAHPEKDTWSLSELAQETGLSPRTIRYYISRGLLAGPLVAGRGAAYGADHLARLRAIQQLQAGGAMLSEIARLLEGRPAGAFLPPPEAWERYQLESDVVVWVRAGSAPWRSQEVRRALSDFAAKIRREENHADDHRES